MIDQLRLDPPTFKEEVDLRYIEHLSRSNFEAVGFIPRPRLEEYAAQGQIFMATENDEAAGFLVFGAGWPALKVWQACIQYDARRRELGARLVERLVGEAQRRGCHIISLWCADDLPANEFWQAMGFRQVSTRRGGIRGHRRHRRHNQWVRSVPTDQMTLGLLA